MTRSEIVRELTIQYPNIPQRTLEQVVKKIFQLMTTVLGRGERIEIRGFGSFDVRHREPRVSRNPKTGESVQTPSKHSAHFKPGKELKERVNALIHVDDAT